MIARGAVAAGCLAGACASPVELPLPAAAFEEREPAPSPLGRSLAYLADEDGDRVADLFLLDLSRPHHPARRIGTGVESAPAWSADGRRLVISKRRAESLDPCWLDLATDTETAFSVAGFEGDLTAPTLSSDGGRVAFAFRKSGAADWDIVLADSGGLNGVVVAPSPFRDFWPRFSADGRYLYFFSRRDTADVDDELYRLDIAAGALERLTDSPGHDFTPAPSPDGRFLAFASQREGPPAVFVLRLADGETRRLTPSGYLAGHPAWSADGHRIYVTLRREGAPADIRAFKFSPF